MSWTPCSGLDAEAGVVWLPRMLQKARRCLTSPDGRAVDGYLFGDNDFIDKEVIAFLRTDDEAITALVRENPSDADVARLIVERSCRSMSAMLPSSVSGKAIESGQDDMWCDRLEWRFTRPSSPFGCARRGGT